MKGDVCVLLPPRPHKVLQQERCLGVEGVNWFPASKEHRHLVTFFSPFSHLFYVREGTIVHIF